ncbi:hypothetical protein COCNU_01G016570 [Cocos nucifera]|uniref:Uncharacterized protein n=1 Tax=Cocos nucifera TaxID=13894 RepID=A0A8K0HX10_COCNU|nr:hypothetical protein COCNU_01G016570 [Cocos nucifera]
MRRCPAWIFYSHDSAHRELPQLVLPLWWRWALTIGGSTMDGIASSGGVPIPGGEGGGDVRPTPPQPLGDRGRGG